jgi:hypothetical protein
MVERRVGLRHAGQWHDSPSFRSEHIMTDTIQPVHAKTHHFRGLRSRHREEPLSPDMKRFDIFLVDTGWNSAVAKMVRSQLPILYEYQKQDTLYILTPEQSVQMLKKAPEAIGHDPIIVVYDLYVEHPGEATNYRGFRLNLGLIRNPEQALARLKEFLRFVACHRTARCLQSEIRRELHREGFRGMVKILREASTELL